MKKIKFLLVVVSLLSIISCSSISQEIKKTQLYNKVIQHNRHNDYVNSSLTAIEFLRDFSDDSRATFMINTINNNIYNAQILAPFSPTKINKDDYGIVRYKNLRTIISALDNAGLNPTILSAIDRSKLSIDTKKKTNIPLTVADINQNIAEQYYLKGNKHYIYNKEDYLVRAKIYQEGLQYYNYKDMAILMEENELNYSGEITESYYQKALQAINNGEYKTASQYLQKTLNSYKEHDNYEDSKTLFNKYDEIWRKEEANQFYKQGQKLATHLKSLQDYESASRAYHNAYLIYEPYGDFKDSYFLAAKYDEVWRKMRAEEYYQKAQSISKYAKTKKEHKEAASYFQLAYTTYQAYGNFKDSYSLAQKEKSLSMVNVYLFPIGDINKAIYFLLKESDDFNIVNNSATSDIAIDASYYKDTDEYKSIISIDEFEDENYQYEEIKEKSERIYTLTVVLKVTNKLNMTESFEVTKSSSIIHTYYEGNYPTYLQASYETLNSSSNSLKSYSALANEAVSDRDYYLSKALDSILQSLVNK
ncbi:hypothetical protein [Entomomonas asaccharolytica]|uniref:Lipoprotein n=1 Tax=Entomomonas asaccharolytica TaxID=2785331 RepID=A0A974RXX0_9GAMM|nr:hypothetical protein [Entomomonas asaccharolytica]QQP85324.1 hypothetical protein JHT90_13210 [Entomomonas asaccharolytica]